MTKLSNRLAAARRNAAAERKWVRDHGVNLAGYIELYGSKDDPDHSGDGGEAIYAADRAALDRALNHLADVTAEAARKARNVKAP